MDTIITAFGLAFFTVAGLMFLCQKLIGWHGIARHKAKVDIGCSVAAFFLFAGTSTMGIFVAVISGFLASVFTSALGKFLVEKRIADDELIAVHNNNVDRSQNALNSIQTMLQQSRGA